MNLNKLEEIRNRTIKEKAMIDQLKILRLTARRLQPDWENCINISLSDDSELAANWDVVLSTLAGKLIHDDKPALEMAICKADERSAVFVRTA